MSRKPDGVTKQDWSVLTTTLFEIQAKRVIQPSQLAYAKKVAVQAKATPAMQKMLTDADTDRLMLASTESGKKQIASQAPLKFQKVGASTPAAPAASTVAAKKPTTAAPRVAQHAPAAPAVASHAAPAPAAGGVKIPAGLAPDQAASYKQLVAAVKSGKAQGISYGKLNFAYEIANRAKDTQTRAQIFGQMHKLRPLVDIPGRYGVTDAEYANYAKVDNAIKTGGGHDVPQKNLVLAHKTAVKYGHTEQADVLAALLPAGAIAATAAVAAKATAKKPPVVKVAQTTKIDAVDNALKSKSPGKPESVSEQDWTTFKSVLDQLGKGSVPQQKDLTVAAQVSGQMHAAHGTNYPLTNTILLHTLAIGDAATVKQLAEARRLSIVEKKPDPVVKIFSQRLVMAGIKSNNPADMKIAEQVARSSGQTKTADAFAQKLKSFAPAAAATTAVAVATTSKTHQGDKPPGGSRPKQPLPAPRNTMLTSYTPDDSRAVEDGMKKLDKYEKEALENGAHKLATKQPVTLKELTDAQAAADKAGLPTVAAKFGKAATDVHQQMAAEQEKRLAGTSARIAARPTPPLKAPPSPTVVAKVPIIPHPQIVVDQSNALGVPPTVTADLIKTAKTGGSASKDAQKTIAEGSATAQAAAAGNTAAQQHIADLQAAATQPGPAAIEAQKKLAGISAANSITVTVNTPGAAAAAAEPLPPPLESGQRTMQPNVPASMPVTQRSSAPRSASRSTSASSEPVADNIPPPPPPTPEEVANPGDTPVSSKLVKGAAVALGVGAVAGGAAKLILDSKKGDQSAKNNMQAGATLVDDLESQDPDTQAAAHSTLAEIKDRQKAGDPSAKLQLEGVAAAAATKKAMEDKARSDKAQVLKDIRGQEVQASVAGPDTGNYVPAVLGSVLLLGGGLFMAIKSKKKAA
jgi:LPXTG-motif cell wall-anchored protein